MCVRLKDLKNKADAEFSQVFKERLVQSDQDVSFMQLEIQFTSNLRLGLEHSAAPDRLFISAPKNFTQFETHFMRFERYIKMPYEMKLAKDKMLADALQDKQKAELLKEEEVINPWLITDFDYCLDDNHFPS